jgi:hypothetical protein
MTRSIQKAALKDLTPAGSDQDRAVAARQSRDQCLMQQIAKAAREGRLETALKLASTDAGASPQFTNAKGVCLLRLGRAEPAVQIYRTLVLQAGCVWTRPDRPLHFKTNFATALLMTGHPGGCLDVLHEIGNEHPHAALLRSAVKSWSRSLPLWRRIDWWINHIEPDNVAITVDFVPGDFGFLAEPGDRVDALTEMSTTQLAV